jgi:metal-sulfur cluster biosynthetic enzyme
VWSNESVLILNEDLQLKTCLCDVHLRITKTVKKCDVTDIFAENVKSVVLKLKKPRLPKYQSRTANRIEPRNGS